MTTTAVTAVARPFAFSGIPDTLQDLSMLPRSELVFVANSIAIDEGALEDQLLDITCTLPSGFTYALAEILMSITSIDADAWDAVVTHRIQDNAAGAAASSFVLDFESISNGVSGVTSTNKQRAYSLQHNAPNIIILPLDQNNGVMFSHCANLTVGDAAGTLQFMARFYVYDIEQAHNVQVNSPMLVR